MTAHDKILAEIIELKPSMIYKIRKGHRYPSFKTMLKIEQELNWNVTQQTEARRLGNYAAQFEAAASNRIHTR